MSPFNERQKVPLRWPGARWDVAGATQPLAHEGLTGLTGVRLWGLLPQPLDGFGCGSPCPQALNGWPTNPRQSNCSNESTVSRGIPSLRDIKLCNNGVARLQTLLAKQSILSPKLFVAPAGQVIQGRLCQWAWGRLPPRWPGVAIEPPSRRTPLTSKEVVSRFRK